MKSTTHQLREYEVYDDKMLTHTRRIYILGISGIHPSAPSYSLSLAYGTKKRD